MLTLILSTLFCLLAATSLVDVAQGHVKLYYTPANLAIRNAPTVTADGTFSTGGPCGGSNSWGPLAKASPVIVGSTLCGRINYNGGHQPDATNKFRAVFNCNSAPPTATTGTTQTGLQNSGSLPLVSGTGPATDDTNKFVPAVEGNVVTEGYTLCITVPAQTLDATIPLESPLRQCTFSIMDQRNWGGCIDVIASNDDGTLPAGITTESPTVPGLSNTKVNNDNLMILASEEGTYLSAEQCATSGGKCCPYTYIGLLGNSRYASMKLTATDSVNCYDLYTASKNPDAYSRGFNYQLVLQPHPVEAGALVAYVNVNLGLGHTIQNLEVMVRDPTNNGISVTNVSPDSPLLADFTAMPFETLTAGVGQQKVQQPVGPYGSGTIALIVIVVVLGVYIVGGILYGKHKTGEWKHIHAPFCWRMCEKAKSKMGHGKKNTTDLASKPENLGPLPAGWKEAKDKEGDTYYYNKAQNKTQWERPT